jgi:hypothetical protein
VLIHADDVEETDRAHADEEEILFVLADEGLSRQDGEG